MAYVTDPTQPAETSSQARNRRRRKAAAKPKPAAAPRAAANPQFGYSPAGDPTQPPSFTAFPQQYTPGERNAARRLASSRVDALLAALPSQKSITDRYGAQSAAAGGMAKSLSDYLAQSQLARVGFAGGAPNIFSQTVQSAAAPAAAVIGQQPATAGTGLIAAMAANTANSMAGAPGAAMAQGNITQGAIGARQTQALNDRAQQATSLRLKLPELEQAAMLDNRDAAYKAWAANENAWLARAQMGQKSNQFNAGQANDAAAQAAANAQDVWQTGVAESGKNARTSATIGAQNARAAAARGDTNNDGKVDAAEKAAGAQKKIIDAALKQAEKWRSATGAAVAATPWVYREERPGQYANDPPLVTYHEFDQPLDRLPAGWSKERDGAPAAPAGPAMSNDQLFNRTVQFMLSRGLSRKRAYNVAKRYLGFTPTATSPAGSAANGLIQG